MIEHCMRIVEKAPNEYLIVTVEYNRDTEHLRYSAATEEVYSSDTVVYRAIHETMRSLPQDTIGQRLCEECIGAWAQRGPTEWKDLEYALWVLGSDDKQVLETNAPNLLAEFLAKRARRNVG